PTHSHTLSLPDALPILTMLAMLVVGIPIYTCASASTPIAAALVLKGLSPGAALVFLLSGPATNIGAIVVLLKFLGLRMVTIYLADRKSTRLNSSHRTIS